MRTKNNFLSKITKIKKTGCCTHNPGGGVENTMEGVWMKCMYCTQNKDGSDVSKFNNPILKFCNSLTAKDIATLAYSI